MVRRDLYINCRLRKKMDNQKLIDDLIDIAIREDIGTGDHTSKSCLSDDIQGKAQLIIKDHGILAGVALAERVFKRIDPSLEMTLYMCDGMKVKPMDIAFHVYGPQISLLTAERLVLNFMQRMSGIATETNRYVGQLKGLSTKVLDTRKTTPGMRLLEKEAVKTGGGENHRIGLYDMILIKDNHIDFAGSIEKAIERVEKYLVVHKMDLKIEVEARTLDDVEKILTKSNVYRILLDNFTIEETRKAVELINGRIETESSGGITIDNIRQYAECGVDYISVGALTHQIKSLDMSLKAV